MEETRCHARRMQAEVTSIFTPAELRALWSLNLDPLALLAKALHKASRARLASKHRRRLPRRVRYLSIYTPPPTTSTTTTTPDSPEHSLGHANQLRDNSISATAGHTSHGLSRDRTPAFTQGRRYCSGRESRGDLEDYTVIARPDTASGITVAK